jgi:hypothetical protein
MSEIQNQAQLESKPIESDAPYISQKGDTLSDIALRAYGDDTLWQEIYIANALAIGEDHRSLSEGTRLFIPANPRKVKMHMASQCCTVIAPAGLNGRARPSVYSGRITGFPYGSQLCFDWVVYGEPVNGNPDWGYTSQYGCYFWMGGTDRP